MFIAHTIVFYKNYTSFTCKHPHKHTQILFLCASKHLYTQTLVLYLYSKFYIFGNFCYYASSFDIFCLLHIVSKNCERVVNSEAYIIFPTMKRKKKRRITIPEPHIQILFLHQAPSTNFSTEKKIQLQLHREHVPNSKKKRKKKQGWKLPSKDHL